MLYIYILELESNKYYIGKTTNPEFRLDKHFDTSTSGASIWTNKYKPVKIIEIHANSDNFDEDKYTLKYMEKYGIDNVRGGSFCQIVLDQEITNTINKMIKNSTDKNNLESIKTEYEEYLQKFNNIEETHNEISFLEKEFEYVKNLNYIFEFINDNWKKTMSYYNKQINEINNLFNKNNNIRTYTQINEINNLFNKNNNIRTYTQAKINILSRFNIKYNENKTEEIFDNFCFFVDNVKDNKFSKDIYASIKIDDFILNIFNQFIVSLINNYDYKIHTQILKSKFKELINNKYIDLDIFEKINLYSDRVKVNKLCLFLLQIENEIKQIYKIHQVKNRESYESKINEKIEILTDKMIKFTEENNDLYSL
jgi:hypothetical protein